MITGFTTGYLPANVLFINCLWRWLNQVVIRVVIQVLFQVALH